MKNKKDRVIAIDYFRGICILIVILSHAYPFSMPYALLTGAGHLWTSAAELFFLISGVTLGVVRGPKILTDFKKIYKKSLLRAFNIYLIYIAAIFLIMLPSLLIHSPGSLSVIGVSASASIEKIILGVLTFHISPGLANFLKFYSVYMVIAPIILWALYKWSKSWLPIVAISTFIFLLNTTYPFKILNPATYTFFGIWQLYFVMGLVLARHRLPIISWLYSLDRVRYRMFHRVINISAVLALLISSTIGYSFLFNQQIVSYAPSFVKNVYIGLIKPNSTINLLFINDRIGVLRPLITLLFFASAYLVYQRHKDWLLSKTGAVVNTFGRETLWVFVGQALVIPFLSALPVKRGLVGNTLLTAVLLYSMWLIANRRQAYAAISVYPKVFIEEYRRGFETGYLARARKYQELDLEENI